MGSDTTGPGTSQTEERQRPSRPCEHLVMKVPRCLSGLVSFQESMFPLPEHNCYFSVNHWWKKKNQETWNWQHPYPILSSSCSTFNPASLMCLRKQRWMAQVLEPLYPLRRPEWSSWLQPIYSGHLGSESVDRRPISVSPFPFLQLCLSHK